MTIQEIKAVISNATGLSIGTLDLRGEENTDGTVDSTWQYCWIEAINNKGQAKRVRVVFPEEVVDTIKANLQFNGLAAKFEVVPAHTKGDINPTTGKTWSNDLVLSYDRYTIITPKFTASL